MGGYCLLHGYHPAGVNHTSATCQWKQTNHDVMATWANRKGGSIYWPPPIRISIKQQCHAAYAGKSAPTN
jgi:ribosomal protein L31